MQNTTDQRIKDILSCSPAIIYALGVDEAFRLTFISENFSTHFGYSTTECLDNPAFWRRNIHPDDCDSVFADQASLYQDGHLAHEYRVRKKDGTYLWVHDELRLIRDTEGEPVEIIGSLLDITDRKETEFALQRSEALFRDFFQANPVATIISEPSGVIHMVNPAFTINPGYTAEEVVGRTTQELGFWLVPADRERMVAAIKEHGFIDNLESTFRGKNNRKMTCLISSRAVVLGGELRILSIVNDISEQRDAEESLRKLDQAKSDFISTAAHELRTPLIAIVGYAELLENTAENVLTEKQKANYLSIIQSHAGVLNRLVDDLLDVGRIQVGRSLGVIRKEHELSGIINNAIESIQLKCPQHTLRVAHYNALPEKTWIDRDRITQVLNNLLINAIKFSPGGGTIKIQTMTDSERVTISIIDQGLGMTPQQVEKIFDRFYRVANADHAVSGLGLGMGIVKQIILDHGGEIFVASNLGEGTTVTFTLPIEESSPGPS